MIRTFGLDSCGFTEGERVACSGFGSWGQETRMGTITRAPDGSLYIAVDARIDRVETTVTVHLGDDHDGPGEDVHPALAEGICARVSGAHEAGDTECMHGECDDCQQARGEDPVNWADPMAVAQETVRRATEKLIGRAFPGYLRAERCECGSGNHTRGPGHANYCQLLER